MFESKQYNLKMKKQKPFNIVMFHISVSGATEGSLQSCGLIGCEAS